MFTGAIPQHPVETIDQSFSTLGLSEPILRVIEQIGFVHPTPIQAAVIPTALSGRDVIGLAQTGSGKTAAFVLPMAERLTHGDVGVRALILAPTREIALQTKAFLDLFGKHHDLTTACLIGGVKMTPQFQALQAKPDIVVATPGRLLDHVKRRSLVLDNVVELVLDEADHMLDLGFLPQIREVLRRLPRERHTMMFSATMPDSIEMIAKEFMRDPARVDILPVGAAEGITHRLYLVKEEDKRKLLLELLHQELGSTLVFTRRKVDAEWLFHILDRQGHPVARIHADQSQSRRVSALQTFREGQHRILVATDIAGRGIDIPGIQQVVNFDIPENEDDYIHRAGRTARGSAIGIVSTIATWQDLPMVKKIEDSLGEKIPRCTMPGVEPWEELEKKAAARRRRV